MGKRKHSKKDHKPVDKTQEELSNLFTKTDELNKVHKNNTWDAEGNARFGIPGDTK